MKKLLILGTLLALAGAGCVTSGNVNVLPTDNSTSTATGTYPPPTSTTTTIPPQTSSGSITAQNQPSGRQILIQTLTLAKPGFIVIHQDANGQPGDVVGRSDLLTAGDHTNVVINLNAINNQTYWAELHQDNGNGTFDAAEDQPILDASGKPITMKFTMTPPGSGSSSTGAGTGSSANINASSTFSAPPSNESSSQRVTIQGLAFSPKTITVDRGEKIVFVNNDTVSHTVTEDQAAFTSPALSKGQSFTLDTSKLPVGKVTYHCTIHPDMKGSVLIK